MKQKEPILVVMAAGMGSRYGGLKQIDSVGPNGEILMDYSLYDAKQAGFERVVFVIRKENRQAFEEAIGRRIAGSFDISYAYQELSDLPEGYVLPQGRVKPWGTGQAVLVAADFVDAPFAVLNADDYYGPSAFNVIYDFLSRYEDATPPTFALVGYVVKNTLSDHGRVTRGVCTVNDAGFLTKIDERPNIEAAGDDVRFLNDDGQTWTTIPGDTPVSMNFWGFGPSLMEDLKSGFKSFLDTALHENPLSSEYYLPIAVDGLLQSGRARVNVLPCSDKWYGVTYKEDKPVVQQAIKRFLSEGRYPEKLWS